MQGLHLVLDEHRAEIHRRLADHIQGLIGGTAVRVYQHGPAGRKVLTETGLRRPDHVTDGAGVVEAGNAHQDIGLADLSDLATDILSEHGGQSLHRLILCVVVGGGGEIACVIAVPVSVTKTL